MKQLERNYLHRESREVAVDLWDRLRDRGRYGSVCFSAFNHFVKGGESVDEVVARKAKHASVIGPCIQSVVLTQLTKDEVAIDVPFRSTEFLKKFPADLIFLRDVLLTPFDLSGMSVSVTCYFANVTIHPMYWAIVLPHLADPIRQMMDIKRKDPFFHRHLVKATAEYLCPEHGSSIANYAQGLRVKKHALRAIKGRDLVEMRSYLRSNYPC